MTCDTDVLPVSVVKFRSMFPEFADSSVYLDEQVEPWLTIAGSLLNQPRWGKVYEMGIALFAAHQIVLSQRATLSTQRGGSIGGIAGIVSSKSVNGASVSYDNSNTLLQGAGPFNLTTYGVQFLYFARLFGAGGIQIVGDDARYGFLPGAYPGPTLING